MTVNSINTNIAAYYAQANIGLASTGAAASVARLSSGNRIVKASDDVAALSTGTSLRTNVTTLRIALINASQGSSLLQVADGALSQVTEILQRQKAIALQAGSGSLTNSDRVFLNQEFQSLVSEIDRIAGTTNFNGVNLINGSLSQSATIADTTAAASKGAASITFNNDILATETVKINGVTLTAATDFTVGSSLAETVDNLASALNDLASNTSYMGSLGQAKFTANGNTLTITARSGGALSNTFYIDASGTATNAGEATISGGYGLDGSFTLFNSTSITSATQIMSATTAAAGTPFQTADTITATINGTTKTLYTVAASATVTDIVNGINNNAGTTGVHAALTYGSGSYNIRLSYTGLASNMLVNLGTNYNGTTYDINGQGVTAAGLNLASGATKNQALFYTKYVDVLSSAGLGAALSTTVTAAVGAVSASVPFAVGDNLSITINGETKVLHTFAAADGLDDILTSINGKTAATGVYATVTGSASSYNLRLYMTDATANYSAISAGANISGGVTLNTTAAATGATLTQTTKGSLNGGADNGIGQSSTAVTGTVGDDILTDLSQNHANVSVLLTQNAVAADTITVGGHAFTFTATSSNASPDEILIGDTLQETLDNAVKTINGYKNYAIDTAAFELNQLNVIRSGNNLVFTGKGLDNVSTISGGNGAVAQSITGASITNSGNLTNASSTYGVNVTGVTNADFAGTISGFSALYKDSADTVDLSIKVGKYTYTAKSVDTTVSSNTRIRLYSDTLDDGTSGGYFDIQLKGNQVETFSSQAGADNVANRLNAAFSSLNFLQKHAISSYAGTQSITANSTVIGSLLGSKVSAQLSSFDGAKLSEVQVTAPSGSNTDASISLTIDGVKFSTAVGLGSTLGANQTYKLVSADDPNQFVEFTTGDSSIDISSDANATAVEAALREAFGAGTGSAALSFQIGTTSDDQLSVSLGSSTTDTLYSGATLDVLSQGNASSASSVLDDALAQVTSLRASVGALQSRFNFASANIQISVQNQDAARGELLDTDIASEATNYATAQVKLQAGISVLAQANQQLQSLLKLIG